MGINKPGKYYNFTLVVSDSTRVSPPFKVLLQISPEPDPNDCVTVALKNIDLEKIITYTIWPLILQAKVTKKCTNNVTMESLVWSCTDVDWQFWQLFGNNNTITMEREDLQRLPKSKDIQMTFT